ncbi:MAG: hypothetical protein DMF74_23310 [Acidobacteria bacterium]|nr:MAG: hypothetical protein DMF74_23310 [Acidobacteriota bacterium]
MLSELRVIIRERSGKTKQRRVSVLKSSFYDFANKELGCWRKLKHCKWQIEKCKLQIEQLGRDRQSPYTGASQICNLHAICNLQFAIFIFQFAIPF